MHRHAVTLVLLAIISITSPAQSQTTTPTHQHAMAGPAIDGSVHPELIPDLTAYRLWLVMVSVPPAPTDNQKYRQNLQIAKIGLSDSDQSLLVPILADFYTQYHKLIDDYNAEATAAWATHGQVPDIASMQSQRDQLVQSFHDQLRVALTSNSWILLNGHVQSQKKKMKLFIAEAQQ